MRHRIRDFAFGVAATSLAFAAFSLAQVSSTSRVPRTTGEQGTTAPAPSPMTATEKMRIMRAASTVPFTGLTGFAALSARVPYIAGKARLSFYNASDYSTGQNQVSFAARSNTTSVIFTTARAGKLHLINVYVYAPTWEKYAVTAERYDGSEKYVSQTHELNSGSRTLSVVFTPPKTGEYIVQVKCEYAHVIQGADISVAE